MFGEGVGVEPSSRLRGHMLEHLRSSVGPHHLIALVAQRLTGRGGDRPSFSGADEDGGDGNAASLELLDHLIDAPSLILAIADDDDISLLGGPGAKQTKPRR